MPDAPPLHRHLQSLQQQLPGLLASALLQGWLDRLRDPSVGQTRDEQRLAAGWAVQLRSDRNKWQALLARSLTESMDAALHARRLPAADGEADPYNLGGLSLLDEGQADCDVEIAHLGHQLARACDASWTPLWQQVSRLPLGGADALPLDLPHYPAAPEVLARGIGEGVQRISTSAAQRGLLMRLAAPACSEGLAAAYGRLQAELSDALQAPPPAPAPRAASPVAAPSRPLPPPEAASPATQLHELLRRMARDPRLSPALQAEVARLEAPLQHMLPQDPGLLCDPGHTAWLFIDELAVHASELPPDDRARRDALTAVVKRRVDALCRDPQPARLRSALVALRVHLAEDATQQASRQQAARHALVLAEHERQLQPMLLQQIQELLEPPAQRTAVPRLLGEFLTTHWPNALARGVVRAIDREGTGSAEAQAWLDWAPALLATLQTPANEAERQRHRQALPALLARMEQGMDAIALPAADREAVMGALMRAHHRLLFSTPEESASLPLESEFEMQAADDWHAVDTAVGALPTVPMPLEAQHEVERCARWLAALKPGMHCKLFLQGTWITAQLTWRSDNGQFFMFSSQLGSGSHSMTRRALERLRMEGLATELATGTLLERAKQGWLDDSGMAPL